jgi:hypothetical protein
MGPQKRVLVILASREFVIAEGCIRPDEDIVSDAKSVPQLDTALDGHAIPQDDIVLDEAVRADIAVTSDSRALQNDYVLPNARSFADRRRLHLGKMMNLACQLPPLFGRNATQL